MIFCLYENNLLVFYDISWIVSNLIDWFYLLVFWINKYSGSFLVLISFFMLFKGIYVGLNFL